MPQQKPIFILAGEASGDAIGGKLITALKQQGDFQFSGIAGPEMLAAGCATLFPQSDISLMGLAEILPHIRTLKKRIDQTVQAIVEAEPDLVITIDAPGFNTRVIAALKETDFYKNGKRPKLVHYVAPSVWAWKPKRVEKFTKLFDGLLCLLPFEPEYFPKLKKTYYVGHPVLESGADQGDGTAFKERYAIDNKVIALLPGSRIGEISRLLPIFREAVSLLPNDITVVIPVVPALKEHPSFKETAEWDRRVILSDPTEKYDLMAASDAAIAASGTVTLELAMAGVPTTVAYKLNGLTYQIAKRLIKLKYASLINILRDEMILPEFLRHNCTSKNLADSTRLFLKQDSQATQYYKSEIAKTLIALKPEGDQTPSQVAASVILTKFMV